MLSGRRYSQDLHFASIFAQRICENTLLVSGFLALKMIFCSSFLSLATEEMIMGINLRANVFMIIFVIFLYEVVLDLTIE